MAALERVGGVGRSSRLIAGVGGGVVRHFQFSSSYQPLPMRPSSARAIRSLCKVGLLDFNRLHGAHRSVRLSMSSPAAEFAARITL